ncbi:MAG: hypothetical protein ACRDL7_05925 [Gaiellaceae bacterium]
MSSYSDLPIDLQRAITAYNAAVVIACEHISKLHKTRPELVMLKIDHLAMNAVSDMSDDEVRAYTRAIDLQRAKGFSLSDAHHPGLDIEVP